MTLDGRRTMAESCRRGSHEPGKQVGVTSMWIVGVKLLIAIYESHRDIIHKGGDSHTNVNPLMPNGAFNVCCPRDAVSRTANVGTVGTNGLRIQYRTFRVLIYCL